MVNLKLDKDYRIISDSYGFILEMQTNPDLAPKHIKKALKSLRIKGLKSSVGSYPYYKKIAYCSKLHKAIKQYLEISLRKSEATTWDDFLQDYKKLKKRINDILDKFEKVII